MFVKLESLFKWKAFVLALPIFFCLLSVNVAAAQGTLQVALSSETPRGTNVPYDSPAIPFTTIELSASDEADVEISAMTVARLHPGYKDDFKQVWLQIDGFKVGAGSAVDINGQAKLSFNPPIIIPAGQTITADVVAALPDTKKIGYKNGFKLLDENSFTTSAISVEGDFPIAGAEMKVEDYKVAELKFAPLGADSMVDAGDSAAEIGEFSFANASTTKKDTELLAITFKNNGTAQLDETLENAALYVADSQASAETNIDGNTITFVLDNGITGGYILEGGKTLNFVIKADIASSAKEGTVSFKIKDLTDIIGTEIGTNFSVNATSGAAANLKAYKVNASNAEAEEDLPVEPEENETVVKEAETITTEDDVVTEPQTLTATPQVETNKDLTANGLSTFNPVVYGLNNQHWGVEYVKTLAEASTITSTDRDRFQANEALNRRAFTKIILKAFNITPSAVVTNAPFKDIPAGDSFAPYAAKAKELGIIKGYEDQTFRPTQTITRVEALKIILETAQTLERLQISGGAMNFPDTTPGSWYESYVAYAQAQQIVSGYADGLFRPANNVTGAEAAKMVSIVSEK